VQSSYKFIADKKPLIQSESSHIQYINNKTDVKDTDIFKFGSKIPKNSNNGTLREVIKH
jgi:hypothetical protein